MIDSDNKAPLLFTQASPSATAPEPDSYTKRPWLLSEPSDDSIKGRLLYISKIGSTSAQFTFKDFNSETGSQAVSVWSASTSESGSLDLSVYELRAASLSPQGDSLDAVISSSYLVRPYFDKLPPAMVPVRWNFNTGHVWQTPTIGNNPKNPKQPNVSLLPIGGNAARSFDHRLLAFQRVRSGQLFGQDAPTPLVDLAISSTQTADKITGMDVEPQPRDTTLAWTRQNTLLYAYSKAFYAKNFDPAQPENPDAIYTEANTLGPFYFTDTPDFATYYPDNSDKKSLIPAHAWPSIYEAAPLAFKGQKVVRAKLLIPNAYAALPSPDGRYIAFLGWERDTPVPAPKKGQKPQVQPSTPQWWLWDRQAQTRTLLSTHAIFPEQAAWTNDSRGIYFFDARTLAAPPIPRTDPNITPPVAVGEEQDVPVHYVDVARLLTARFGKDPSHATEEVGSLHVRPTLNQHLSDYTPTTLRMRGLTNDRKFVLVDVRSYDNRPGPEKKNLPYDATIDTIHALRLSDKSDQTAAKLEMCFAYDWLDLSAPAR